MDLSQGLDLDHTEATVRVNTFLSVIDSEIKRLTGLCEYCVSVPLVGVDHELVEVCVFLDEAQRNHLRDVSVRVPQLVQFQVDSEHVFSDGV